MRKLIFMVCLINGCSLKVWELLSLPNVATLEDPELNQQEGTQISPRLNLTTGYSNNYFEHSGPIPFSVDFPLARIMIRRSCCDMGINLGSSGVTESFRISVLKHPIRLTLNPGLTQWVLPIEGPFFAGSAFLNSFVSFPVANTNQLYLGGKFLWWISPYLSTVFDHEELVSSRLMGAFVGFRIGNSGSVTPVLLEVGVLKGFWEGKNEINPFGIATILPYAGISFPLPR
ncbi:hypothetical protein DRP53_07545 [candidate division WOR-3 bacterium]|uniref:Uncharacterized protein n=1 Tax=candidate division WOR-3 bacterium TaxID=2052148 RepID=A0A660SGG5_UNCW3|nr:MAG: hypothetical protein DRP53_07545 [candidate division WOR-3 bacterium]